jgi:hypothetical protein
MSETAQNGSDLLAMIDAQNTNETQIDAGDNEPVETNEDGENTIRENTENEVVFYAEEGDVFINQNSIPTMIVLAVTQMADGSKNYRVRFPLIANKPIVITEREAGQFAIQNALSKLLMYRDTMRDVTSKMVLNSGDVFTKNGEMIVAILTDEFVYVDHEGNSMNVVGCSINGNVGVYRDSFELKVFLFENSDEFAGLRSSGMEG